jgi:hypothetical protein
MKQVILHYSKGKNNEQKSEQQKKFKKGTGKNHERKKSR